MFCPLQRRLAGLLPLPPLCAPGFPTHWSCHWVVTVSLPLLGEGCHLTEAILGSPGKGIVVEMDQRVLMLTSPLGSLRPLSRYSLSAPPSCPFSHFPACSITEETDHYDLIMTREGAGDLLRNSHWVWPAGSSRGGFGGRRVGGVFSLSPSIFPLCLFLGSSSPSLHGWEGN